jgi:hypothetical protein
MENISLKQAISAIYDMELNNYLMTRAVKSLDGALHKQLPRTADDFDMPEKPTQPKTPVDDTGIAANTITAAIIGAIGGAVIKFDVVIFDEASQIFPWDAVGAISRGKQVIVVGAGAAGTMAAGVAAENSADVLLLERNDKIGRKVMITGKGRCNVTNNVTDVQEFISNVPGNGRFLYSAFSLFNSQDVIDFFEDYGVKKVLYGHVHGEEGFKNSIKGEHHGTEYQLVSCDYLNCKPLLIKE